MEKSSDQAATQAHGDRVRTRPRLQLRQEVPDVRLDGLLGEKQPLADLAIHEPVGDQLQYLDLPHGRLLLELGGAAERNHLRTGSQGAARGHLLEVPRVRQVTAEDLLALGGVHEDGIGLVREIFRKDGYFLTQIVA